jgi:hypothetical protein
MKIGKCVSDVLSATAVNVHGQVHVAVAVHVNG